MLPLVALLDWVEPVLEDTDVLPVVELPVTGIEVLTVTVELPEVVVMTVLLNEVEAEVIVELLVVDEAVLVQSNRHAIRRRLREDCIDLVGDLAICRKVIRKVCIVPLQRYIEGKHSHDVADGR